MNLAGIIYCLAIALVLGVIALLTYRRRSPMPIPPWGGKSAFRPNTEYISDYNKANAKVWAIYAVGFIAPAAAFIFNTGAAGIVLVLWGGFGLGALICAQIRIYKKYNISFDEWI